MPVTPDHLKYFKALLEGRDVPRWQDWWPLHSGDFEDLPRSRYLKLKFEKLRQVAVELERAGVEFSWSPEARVAAKFASHDPELLDQKGLPTRELFQNEFGGIITAFEEYDAQRGRSLIKRRLNSILKKDALERASELEDLEFDAEYLFVAGYEAAALTILSCIAEVDELDDLLHAAVENARSFVERHSPDASGKAGP